MQELFFARSHSYISLPKQGLASFISRPDGASIRVDTLFVENTVQEMNVAFTNLQSLVCRRDPRPLDCKLRSTLLRLKAVPWKSRNVLMNSLRLLMFNNIL